MPSRPTPPVASPPPTLFHGSLNFDYQLRNELSLAIGKSELSRKEIAERMSDLSATRVNKTHLDSWTAPSRVEWNMPVRVAVAFDVATGSTRVLDLLAKMHGRTVLLPREVLDAELGALAREEAAIQQRRAEILSAMSATGVAR